MAVLITPTSLSTPIQRLRGVLHAWPIPFGWSVDLGGRDVPLDRRLLDDPSDIYPRCVVPMQQLTTLVRHRLLSVRRAFVGRSVGLKPVAYKT